MTRYLLAGAAGLALTLAAAAPSPAGPLDMPGFTKAFSCSACHGEAGASRSSAVPVLAGMPAWYLKKAIEDYAAGKRPSAEMEPFAKMVKQLGVDEVAAYFAAQPRQPSAVTVEKVSVVNGRKASAACATCHGDDGRGNQARGVPDLTGQPPGYLKNQMILFKADRRSPGDPALTQVKAIMKTLDDATLADLAAYYSSLGR